MNEHHNSQVQPPRSSGGSQINQSMPKKYTILPEIKILQDRLQDMFTNRSDLVNVTGDGWAAAHQNEIREMRWVYVKSLWSLAIHVVIFSVIIGELLSIFTGVLFEVGLIVPALLFALISISFIVIPLGYLLYAEILTAESGKWSIGPNTTAFHDKMKLEMDLIASSTWFIAVASFFLTLFLLGVLDGYILKGIVAGLNVFSIVIPEHLEGPMLDGGVVYGLILFMATIAGFYILRAKILTNVRNVAAEIASKNKASQELYKYKDSVDEARTLFSKKQRGNS